MERPTPALHLSRITLDLRQLRAEPHTKEVGHHGVYSSIAFDQHAATTVAAVLLPGQRTPALHPLSSDSPTILRFVRRLGARPAPCGAATKPGPCGFELQRALTQHGHPLRRHRARPDSAAARRSHQDGSPRCRASSRCSIAPARSPRFIFRREQEEAARDLLRCREDIRADLLRARHRLSKFLLRHGRRFTATKKAWSKRHDGLAPRADVAPRRRSSRRTGPICGRSTKRSPVSARSSRISRALLDARAVARRASSGCAASAGSTISPR